LFLLLVKIKDDQDGTTPEDVASAAPVVAEQQPPSHHEPDSPPSLTLINPPTLENAVVALQSAEGGGKIALRSFHGTYLSARDRGGIVLVTHAHQGWEEWTEVPNADGSVSLISHRGTYLSVFHGSVCSSVTIGTAGRTGTDWDDEILLACIRFEA
jgi:hypothetical protein